MSVSRKGKKNNNRKVRGTKAVNTLLERWTWGVFNHVGPLCLHTVLSGGSEATRQTVPTGKTYAWMWDGHASASGQRRPLRRAARDQNWEELEEGPQLFL